MPLLTTAKPLYTSAMKNVTLRQKERTVQPSMESSVTLRSPKQGQSTYMQRRSLNISHFNALHNAVSNLARFDDFDLEQLGDGFFSDVFKATHKQTGQVMALKRNKATNTKMNILREIQLMNRLTHPNILKFVGVCVNEGQLHALMEYMPEGDLDQFITDQERRLSWKLRTYLALDVARGMQYLHSVGIFHRDLSARNCLVKLNSDRRRRAKYSCVVADLGLAEKIPTTPEDEARLTMVGTPYIMAPEVLLGKPYNEKADIFSYGLLLCQLIARVSFDPEELPRSNDFGLAQDLFHKMVTVAPPPGSCPDTSFPPPNNFLQLAFDSCEMDPFSRPFFSVIVSRLEEMLVTLKRNHVNSTSYKACALSKYALPSGGFNSIVNSNDPSPLLLHKKGAHAKLSRSYSDVSREMIQHAASVLSSTFQNDNNDCDSDDDDDGFSNPFEDMEHLNFGRMKLVDEPSLALLEMTFDLASSDGLKTSWDHTTKSSRKYARPSSSYAEDKNVLANHDHVYRHHHLSSSSSSVLHPRTQELRVTETDSRTQRASCSEELLTQCEDCNYQRARHRAMILSPLGNHLASSWFSRHRNNTKDVEQQRQAIATVMSILSKKLLNLRRSISVPDLSQVSSLFHHVDAEAENKILHTLGIPPDAMGSRSSSPDELFADSAQDQKKFCSSSQNQPPSDAVDTGNDSFLTITVDKTFVNDDASETESPSDNSATDPTNTITSLIGIEVPIKSGEIAQQQRRNLKITPPETGVSPDVRRSSDSSPSSLRPPPECIVTDFSESPKFNNRDSGYEELLSNLQPSTPPIIHSTH